MNKTTFWKIARQCELLKKIAENPMPEIEPLFDEPYILAIRVWRCSESDPEKIARRLGISEQTAKQILAALA